MPPPAVELSDDDPPVDAVVLDAVELAAEVDDVEAPPPLPPHPVSISPPAANAARNREPVVIIPPGTWSYAALRGPCPTL